MSNGIIRAICGDMKKVEPAQTAIFAVIVDGTRDVNGQEQESICVRYVTDDLFPNEAFIGFYTAESTTGETLRQIVLDVLCRLQLPTENLRGQTFDGASNMSGVYNGAQALIREVQPLAIFVHLVHIALILSLKQHARLHNLFVMPLTLYTSWASCQSSLANFRLFSQV